MNSADFLAVRERTAALAARLEIEDFVPRSHPEANPARWHLGHTTLFFETEALAPAGITVPGSRPVYRRVFAAGSRGLPRAARSRISRPTVTEVFRYRREVDDAVAAALDRDPGDAFVAAVRLGVHHELLHQERMLVDLKHLFWKNPEQPAYRRPGAGAAAAAPPGVSNAVPLRFVAFSGGDVGIGRNREDGFAWPQETPRHRPRIAPFRLASRLATNGEFLEFVEEGGYRKPELWLPSGRALVRQERLEHPLYWERDGDRWFEFTLRGRAPLDPAAPVTHVSFFETAAFARWRDARLPTEFEWEAAAAGRPLAGRFLEGGDLVPGAAGPREAGPGGAGPAQLLGTAWEWTTSADLPWPRAVSSGLAADLGGGFFGGKLVVRGGSCLTPTADIRPTRRLFLAPAARLQVTGIRLARDA